MQSASLRNTACLCQGKSTLPITFEEQAATQRQHAWHVCVFSVTNAEWWLFPESSGKLMQRV
jgi:hypothetical protein